MAAVWPAGPLPIMQTFVFMSSFAVMAAALTKRANALRLSLIEALNV